MSKSQRASTTEWCKRVNELNKRIAALESKLSKLQRAAIAVTMASERMEELLVVEELIKEQGG